MVDAVVSTKYGKRPVLDVPPMKAFGSNNVQVSSMMDYNTSSLIQQPQQQMQYVPPQQPQYVTAPQQQQGQYAQAPPQLQTQYPSIHQQVPPQQPPYQPSAYNPYAGAGFQADQRFSASAPAGPMTDPNNFMLSMMGPLNPFNPANMMGPPLAPPPVPQMQFPQMQFPAPVPNFNFPPPPDYNRGHTTYPDQRYGQPPPPPPPRYPAMNQPVHTGPEDNYSLQGKLEFGKMTTVHVDSITGNFRQLPEILRKELKKTYGKYPETDIKISVENGEYHIYASPHREDDRPIRGPRAYDDDEKRPYNHDDFKRKPRFEEDYRPKPPREYDPDFIRGRGFEQEVRLREFDDFPRRDRVDAHRGSHDSRMADAEWVLVKRR
ncbi:uncharacterized protein LOC126815447 [Patella vulgata]|uniref:uncharacterized protein LOC126815447 n=1 Tax=Patella vulgata TaxID=6465 RepID=UPI00217F3093|nr:uncharacterized protein LOC126815447 [Patella vulgata]